MKVKVGISNRHIHLTEEDYKLLFDDQIKNEKNLNQPNEFKSDKTVTLKTLKDEIKNIRLIGPFRSYTQVEITKTDSYILGLNPPIAESGDLNEAQEIIIKTAKNEIKRKCVIIAQRHIHITKEEQKNYNLNNKKCKVKISTQKSGIIEDVYIKTSENYKFELHLDTDDANAFLLNQGDEVEIID